MDVSNLSPDTWLLDRMAPHTRGGHSGHTKHEENVSGFDSLQADLSRGLKYGTIKEKKCLIQEDEMQDDRLDRKDSRCDKRILARDRLSGCEQQQGLNIV